MSMPFVTSPEEYLRIKSEAARVVRLDAQISEPVFARGIEDFRYIDFCEFSGKPFGQLLRAVSDSFGDEGDRGGEWQFLEGNQLPDRPPACKTYTAIQTWV